MINDYASISIVVKYINANEGEMISAKLPDDDKDGK